MIRRIFLIYTVSLLGGYAHAADVTQDLDIVRQSVRTEVVYYLNGIYGLDKVKNDIQVKIGNLDSRLRLHHCDSSLRSTVKENNYGAKNVSVKVQCTSGSRWTIYVPVSLDIYDDVAVSTRNLRKGDVITSADFSFKRTNTSMLNASYLDTPSTLLGKEVRRPIRSGSVIKHQDVQEADLVSKGDTVVMTVAHGALEVKSEGTALNNGHLGEQIQVRNRVSKRIVDARVTGRGTAEVAL